MSYKGSHLVFSLQSVYWQTVGVLSVYPLVWNHCRARAKSVLRLVSDVFETKLKAALEK